MKYILFVLLSLILTSCAQDPPNMSGLPSAIGKFQDGNVTCYTFYQHSISCVVSK